MHGVAFDEFSPQDWGSFNLVYVEGVYSEDEEGRGREVVVMVEGAEEVAFVILTDRLSELGLFCAVNAPAIDGLDQ